MLTPCYPSYGPSESRKSKQTNKQPNTKEQTHLKPCWNNSSASNISAFEDWALKSCKEAWKDLFYQDIYRDNVQRAQALHLKQQDESIRRYTFTPIDRSRRMHSHLILSAQDINPFEFCIFELFSAGSQQIQLTSLDKCC